MKLSFFFYQYCYNQKSYMLGYWNLRCFTSKISATEKYCRIVNNKTSTKTSKQMVQRSVGIQRKFSDKLNSCNSNVTSGKMKTNCLRFFSKTNKMVVLFLNFHLDEKNWKKRPRLLVTSFCKKKLKIFFLATRLR